MKIVDKVAKARDVHDNLPRAQGLKLYAEPRPKVCLLACTVGGRVLVLVYAIVRVHLNGA